MTQFPDIIPGEYGDPYILCMRALGLSVGQDDGTYGPDVQLTRAQMASMLVRLWQGVLMRGCPGLTHPYRDVDPRSPHAQAIGCLYRLGLTKGTSPSTYGPAESLKTSQISRFLLRVWEKLGFTCPYGTNEVVRAAACLTRLHVTPSASEASRALTVIRSQQAVYLIGLWYQVSGAGTPPVPPHRPR